MRGKPDTTAPLLLQQRITPADAGKTINFAFVSAAKWDHPRGCGENGEGLIFLLRICGSPPRMRGKRKKNCGAVYGIRITPADAGKTTDEDVWEFLRQDHPRGCGENESR